MLTNRNAPALAERESVDCVRAGYNGADTTTGLRTLVLTRAGFTMNRATLLSSLAFGEVHHA